MRSSYLALMTLFTVTACGGKDEAPTTPAGEMASLAWELMKPLDSSIKCKQIGDALEPWLKERAPRFEELVKTVDKLVGADANNFDRVSMKLESVATRCVNPSGPRMDVNEHDERVARVLGMFPKMQMGFEMR